MERCDIMQCYFNHDSRCAVIRAEAIVSGRPAGLEEYPAFCPRREKE